MKSKIRLIIVACFIAGVAVTGFNMAQNHNNLDVSLADITVMARGDGESGGSQPCYNFLIRTIGWTDYDCSTCAPIWDMQGRSYVDNC